MKPACSTVNEHVTSKVALSTGQSPLRIIYTVLPLSRSVNGMSAAVPRLCVAPVIVHVELLAIERSSIRPNGANLGPGAGQAADSRSFHRSALVRSVGFPALLIAHPDLAGVY